MLILPTWKTLNVAHAENDLKALLAAARDEVKAILAKPSPQFADLVVALDEIENKISLFFAPLSHLQAVKNDVGFRESYERCLQQLTLYHSELLQNTALYEAYLALEKSTEYQTLRPEAKKVIRDALRHFRLSGVALAPKAKARFQEIELKLSELASAFENHLLDAGNHFVFHLEDKSDLTGLPENVIVLAKEKAMARQEKGFMLGLDAPTYTAVMTYAQNRALRQKMYEAYTTRASDEGPDKGLFDNSALMVEILHLKHELATLLGFANYAQYSLTTKMAKSEAEVLHFIEELAARVRPFAKRELSELQEFANKEGFHGTLQVWDIAFYSERLKEKRFGFSDEAVREYFPLEKVLAGFFKLLHQLYGVQFKKQDVDTWHKDVTFYELYNKANDLIGGVYLDLYARKDKRGGAWMDSCATRFKNRAGEVQLPVAFLNCNFRPPVPHQPSTLTLDDINTLFHEFGHVLHHLLSKADYLDISGTHGSDADFVEVPSQFMENFCYAREIIFELSSHIKTHTPLPAELFDELMKSRSFQAGLLMLRQLEFALFDFRLHQKPIHNAADIQRVLDEVRAAIAVIKPPAFNRFQHSFSHIFAGGYAAGYYSYKWAEVLSSDAFSRFEEEGVVNPNVGQDFLHAILEKGAGDEPMNMFIDFRGRPPKIDALLRHNGLE